MGAYHDHPGAFRIGNTVYLPGWISVHEDSPDQELLLFERSLDRFQFLPGVIQYPAGNLPLVLPRWLIPAGWFCKNLLCLSGVKHVYKDHRFAACSPQLYHIAEGTC